MIGLAIAVVVIAAILLLRVGAYVEYSDSGLKALARVGFVKITLMPRKKTDRKKSRQKAKTGAKKAKRPQEPKRPGSVIDFKKLISESVGLMGRLKRRILIKRLTVHYVQGGGDPFTMAMMHGGISAAMGVTQGVLETAFRVKRYDFHTSVDFLASEPRVYAEAEISIAVWEIISLGVAALRAFLRARKPNKTEQNLKEQTDVQKSAETA